MKQKTIEIDLVSEDLKEIIGRQEFIIGTVPQKGDVIDIPDNSITRPNHGKHIVLYRLYEKSHEKGFEYALEPSLVVKKIEEEWEPKNGEEIIPLINGEVLRNDPTAYYLGRTIVRPGYVVELKNGGLCAVTSVKQLTK